MGGSDGIAKRQKQRQKVSHSSRGPSSPSASDAEFVSKSTKQVARNAAPPSGDEDSAKRQEEGRQKREKKRQKVSHSTRGPSPVSASDSTSASELTKQVARDAEPSSSDASSDEDDDHRSVKVQEPKRTLKADISAEEESDKGDTTDAEADETVEAKTFQDLGVVDVLAEACIALKYDKPTQIQAKSIPVALQGKDIVALAETGSGKTAAFAIPILQALLDKPQPLFSLVLAPTRELAFQIGKTFEALGATISLRVCTIVGGMDFTPQQIALAKKPHVVVATPGRILDHLERTKGFSFRALRYLVLDEADRLLQLEFGPVIEKILIFMPRERNTLLFSATMSSKVESLQRASLREPVRISVKESKYQTVKTLRQNYILIPLMHKDTYLVWLLATEFFGRSAIIFTRTVNDTQRIAILLRTLGLGAVPLHGQLSQTNRLGALNKFKAGNRDILVATDVAARGLDVPNVDIVVNYDLPGDSKTYVHRVGRTARAGKSGRAINLVTQYDFEIFLRIEKALGEKQTEYPTEKDEVMVFKPRVEEAQREARNQMKDLHADRGKKGAVLKGRPARSRGGKRSRDEMDAEQG